MSASYFQPTIGGVRKLLEALGYTVELERRCGRHDCELVVAHSVHGPPEDKCPDPTDHHDFVLGETTLTARKRHRTATGS